jgi:F-type H+-transporting ATPase subunit a
LVHIDIAAEPLFSIGPLTVTNSMVGAVLASIILLAAAGWFTRRASLVPGRLQSVIEWPFEWIAGIVRSTGGKRWQEFAGFVVGLFVFLLIANWLSLVPGVGTIGYLHHAEDGQEILVPFVRAGAADLNLTLGLAIVSFVTFVGFGLRANGLLGYLKEIFVQEPAYMSPLLTPIHILSELSRLISLSMRLFGNVFAGEVLLTITLTLTTILVVTYPLTIIGGLFFMGLELIFGFVQALVFGMLSMAYIILAIAEYRHHDSNAGTSGAGPHGEEASPAA